MLKRLIAVFIILSNGLLPYIAYAQRGRGGSVRVRGYTKRDGTYVPPHYRSAPDGNFYNNWSTKGNVNPYTGKEGTRVTPPSNYSSQPAGPPVFWTVPGSSPSTSVKIEKPIPPHKTDRATSISTPALINVSPLTRPPLTAVEHYQQGMSLYREKNYKEALHSFKQAAQLEPNNRLAHYFAGISSYYLADYYPALAALKKALKLNPNSAGVHFWIGTVYIQLEEDYTAIQYFKKSIRLAADFAPAQCGLGISYFLTDRYGLAEWHLRRATLLEPSYVLPHLVLGLVYLQAGKRAKAMDEYEILFRTDAEMANYLLTQIRKQ